MKHSTNMQINEHIIKVSGSANIEQGLVMDQEVTLIVKGSVVAIQDGSNQDGTINRTYKVKAAEVEVK